MPELENVEQVKVAGFVSPRRTKNKERIEKEEQELQEQLDWDLTLEAVPTAAERNRGGRG